MSIVERFLEFACPDHHVRGLPAHKMAQHAAMRLLEQRPSLARENIYTAVVCGEVEEVARLLDGHPELANTRCPAIGPDRSGAGGNYDFLGDLGSKPWEPLLYLCFARLPLGATNDRAVDIARLLLDRGANPNAFFMAGDSRYTPLTGVAGEGEENRPPHPKRDALARLLLERGAEPYDSQVIYDIHFRGAILWWMELMYEFSVKAGRAADWTDPEWHMLDQGNYGTGARWHLGVAVENNDIELAEWCVAHGATPNAAPPPDQRFPQSSLYSRAVRLGHDQVADRLLRAGAREEDVALGDEEQFVAACLRMDQAVIDALLTRHPEYLRRPTAMFAAAETNRVDVARLLLDRGTPLDVQDGEAQRPLHVAAANNALAVAELLIARGAEIDPYEHRYNNTPLDFAVYYDLTDMIAVLSPHSRDVWNLTRTGQLERLRQILPENPRLATVTRRTTPLFWLPDDEDVAIEIAALLIAHGADRSFRSTKDGSTAADIARRRGMLHLAAALTGNP